MGLLTEVGWPVERLCAEASAAAREAGEGGGSSSTAWGQVGERTLGDVDAELDGLDQERTSLDAQRDAAMRRQARLRYAHIREPTCPFLVLPFARTWMTPGLFCSKYPQALPSCSRPGRSAVPYIERGSRRRVYMERLMKAN